MNPEIQHGSLIFNDNSELLVYFAIVLISAVFFYLSWYFFQWLFLKIELRHYMERDRAGRIRFSGFCVSNIHHTLLSVYLIWCFAVICDVNSEFPVGVKGRFLWFSNDVCLIQVSKYPAYGICFSIGYLSYDIFYNNSVIIDPKPIQPQTIIHHIVSIIGIVTALMGGWNQVLGAAGVLLCEVSSIFLAFRGL